MANMNFDEFKQAIVDQIKDYLPDRYQDMDVILQQITKNNDTVLDAVLISNVETNISPTIYVNGLYEDYQNGRSMDSILEQIADMRVSNELDMNFDVSRIMNFDQAKDHIVARLVNAEENSNRLDGVPFTQVEDLAITYHIDLGSNSSSSMSVQVQEPMLAAYGITKEELHDLAMANTQQNAPATFKSMTQTMTEIMLPDMMASMNVSREEAMQMIEDMLPPDEGTMWVLTNEDKMNGAIAMMDTEMLDDIREQIGGDFYILPSSIHEVLIVPKEAGMSVADLEDMVQTVNATEVQPQERLSDHVYAYDAETKEIYRADKEEAREAEKAARREKEATKDKSKSKDQGKETRSSLKDRMKDKQKQVDAAKDVAKSAPAKKKDIGLE